MPAPAAVDLARHEWRDAYQRLEDETRDARRRDRLHAQVEALVEELRRRIGQWYTLEELAEAYTGAEAWSREVVAERAPGPEWVRTLSLVEGAAFHVYSRGAVDYRP